jgi:DNA-binding IclR family transcriptional regulator
MSQDLVKSAARALDILDAFATRRQPMTATELGTALGYPKSSMSVLLKSLVRQGYLSLGGRDQAYFPTLKVARLGDWVAGSLIGSERLLELLAELRSATGETVTLTGPLDLQMRCLYALIGTHPIALQVEEGVRFPMIGTAIGAAWLSSQPDKEVEALLARWTKQDGRSVQDAEPTREEVRDVRARGYAKAYDAVLPDTGAVAVPIRTAGTEHALVVAVAGLNSRIRAEEHRIVAALNELLRPFLEPL